MANECKGRSYDALARELHLAYATILEDERKIKELENVNEELKKEISEIYRRLGGMVDEAV